MEPSSKLHLCVIRTQEGKTFRAIDRILTEVANDRIFGRSIHIVFTMNTLLNNAQFAKRLQDIEEAHKGAVVVFSSRYEGPYRHVTSKTELQGICLDQDTCPRVVVMCNNTRRCTDGLDFLKVLNRNRTHIHRAFAYYDELHKYIKGVRSQIEALNAMPIVKGIIAMTATPNGIWMKTGFWSRIQLLYLDDLNDANYSGIKDMVFNCIDLPGVSQSHLTHGSVREAERHVIAYVEHILDINPNILATGSRSFIPAHTRQVGHNRIRDIIFERCPEAVVCLFNGAEKTLKYMDGTTKIGNGDMKTIGLSCVNEEASESIARIIKEQGLTGRPLVITGYLCVNMGQTLLHRSLGTFTTIIISHLDLNNDDIYQLMGRGSGRTKGWGSAYVQTQVYCPTAIMHRCLVMEECARNMAREHNGDVVSQEDYRAPMKTMGEAGEAAINNMRGRDVEVEANANANADTDKAFQIFDKQAQAIEFALKELGWKISKRPTNDAPKTLLEAGANPSVDALLKRMWGIDANTKVRMVPTKEAKWCVYWRPSRIV